ncbi:hypothetical protein [Niallia sp. 03133]|uniref:hypothetical protein n=1 Tax=Niallia sp. 03133 TaxID=3458060 RepID=UPI00404510C9
MEKAVIVGAYHFIGIHLCSALLEKGFQIFGISYPNIKIENLDDKKLVFGRNANFVETEWSAFLKEWNEEDIFTIFDLYTLDKREQLCSFLLSEYAAAIMEKKKISQKVILVVPITINYNLLNEWKNTMLSNNLRYQIIYLPTMYGPWQSGDFLFRQILSNTEETIRKHEMEYTNDAIFIEDSVEVIINEVLQGEEKEILLKSTVEHHWKKCADHLQWNRDSGEKNDIRFLDDTITTIMVKNKNDLSQNLELQRKHINMYIDLKNDRKNK